MNLKPQTILLCSLLLTNSITKANSSFGMEYNYNYAKVTGFSQTPMGGNLGTTSSRRPTFSELGIDYEDHHSLEIFYNYNDYTITANYRDLKVNDNTILTSGLITHAQPIPTASAYQAWVTYDWLSINFSKTFSFNDNIINFAPELSFQGVKYDYEFESGVITSGRNFNVFTTAFGLNCKWKITQNSYIDGGFLLSLPYFNLKTYQANIKLIYDYNLNQHIAISPLLGIEAFQVKMVDNQKVPNHIRYQAVPNYIAGIKLSFK